MGKSYFLKKGIPASRIKAVSKGNMELRKICEGTIDCREEEIAEESDDAAQEREAADGGDQALAMEDLRVRPDDKARIDAGHDEIAQRVPLGRRLATPEEIAEVREWQRQSDANLRRLRELVDRGEQRRGVLGVRPQADADAVEQVCPFCDSRTAVWLDKHGTATYRACKHFQQVVLIAGRLQLEFTQR